VVASTLLTGCSTEDAKQAVGEHIYNLTGMAFFDYQPVRDNKSYTAYGALEADPNKKANSGVTGYDMPSSNNDTETETENTEVDTENTEVETEITETTEIDTSSIETEPTEVDVNEVYYN
jgi:hypothetical protein